MDSKKKSDLLFADVLFLSHFVIVLFILFGWLLPRLSSAYIVILAATLLSWLFLGYCFLSKWEFAIRKKYDQYFNHDDRTLNDGYIAHYGRKIFRLSLPVRTIQRWGIVFIILMLVITVSFRLFSTDTARATVGLLG